MFPLSLSLNLCSRTDCVYMCTGNVSVPSLVCEPQSVLVSARAFREGVCSNNQESDSPLKTSQWETDMERDAASETADQ